MGFSHKNDRGASTSPYYTTCNVAVTVYILWFRSFPFFLQLIMNKINISVLRIQDKTPEATL